MPDNIKQYPLTTQECFDNPDEIVIPYGRNELRKPVPELTEKKKRKRIKYIKVSRIKKK